MGLEATPIAVGAKAETLTPFSYHSLMVQSGSATLPELISDNAIAFGLASVLGMLSSSAALPAKDYRRHISAMPHRCSVFTTDEPELLPPITKRLNLDEEAGYQKKIQDVSKKGNLQTFFQIQEVPPGKVFKGAVFGFDPFEATGENELVLRVGLHRGGMVRLTRDKTIKKVRLNAATSALFGRELEVDRYCLYNIQLTPWCELDEAAAEARQWR